jgi:hypothetical protein
MEKECCLWTYLRTWIRDLLDHDRSRPRRRRRSTCHASRTSSEEAGLCSTRIEAVSPEAGRKLVQRRSPETAAEGEGRVTHQG